MPSRSQPNQNQPLTKEDVVYLIERFQKFADKEAQQKLVLHYRGLVDSIARRYSKGKPFHEDICQVGIIGLLGAIQRYDSSVGKNFEAFAVPTIIGEIKRFLRDKTWSVHVPRRIKELGPKIKNTVETLTVKLQRSPKIEEIAAYLGAPEEEILEAMEMGKSYQALSVDHTIEADADGGTMTLLDIVGTIDKGYERINKKLVLEKALYVLTEREKLIIQYIFLDNMSQKETGEKLGISQMHVSRLQRKAINKLKESIREETNSSERIL